MPIDMSKDYQTMREGCARVHLKNEVAIHVSGAECLEVVDSLFTRDLEMLLPNRGTNGLFLEDSGKIIAFATIFKGDDELYLFTELQSLERTVQYLESHSEGRNVEFRNCSDSHKLVSLIGPHAENAMTENVDEDILGLPYLSFENSINLDTLVFRMGLTGEYEYRILVPNGDEDLFERLGKAGDEFTVQDADESELPLLLLEMRSLRLSDSATNLDPLEFGLHWMIDFQKPEFPGKQALADRLDSIERCGLMIQGNSEDKFEPGDKLEIEGQEVGEVIRSVLSPKIDARIGIALVDNDVGCVGNRFKIKGNPDQPPVRGVSSPLFVTRSITEN